MDAMCSYGLPLFSLDDNSTLEVIKRLRRFRTFYEPYHGYLCTVICSFGILTNLINVVVLTKRQMRTSINVLLTGIAFCDMGTMASYLIYIIHFVLSEHYCNPFLYTYGWMCFLMGHVMLSIALHSTTLWLSVAMAFIRTMTLRQTRVGSPWLRSTNTWKICVIIYSCVFALSVSSVFSNGIMPWPEYFNQTCPPSFPNVIRRHEAYTIGVPPENCLVFTITFWLTGTLFKIIPCVLLTVLIFSLLFMIKRAERNRKGLLDVNRNRAISLTAGLLPNLRNANESRGAVTSTADRTTIMLLMILLLSLLTELPQGAVSILSGIYVAHMQEYVYPNVADILDLLSLINSSVNFILYCIMSSKYRQAFWHVILPRRVYVAWFIRPRQSARCRSRSRRRNHPGRTRDGSRFQHGLNNGLLELEPTNDFCTTNPYTFTGMSEFDNRRHSCKSTAPGSSMSNIYSRSLLLPTQSTNLLTIPTVPSTTSLTSLPSTSRFNPSSNDKRSSCNFNYTEQTLYVPDRCPERSSTSDRFRREFKDRLHAPRLFQRRRSTNSRSRSSLWLVGCSCLCKCAFKSDPEVTTGEDGHQVVVEAPDSYNPQMTPPKIHQVNTVSKDVFSSTVHIEETEPTVCL